jgi:hypothetical protein
LVDLGPLARVGTPAGGFPPFFGFVSAIWVRGQNPNFFQWLAVGEKEMRSLTVAEQQPDTQTSNQQRRLYEKVYDSA